MIALAKFNNTCELVRNLSPKLEVSSNQREDFADFSYKLRAVLLEQGIDDIVFNPAALKNCSG